MSWSRLFRLFTLLALLLAPMAMMGEHAAMAMPMPAAVSVAGDQATMDMAHCNGSDERTSDVQGDVAIDCMMACSALPSTAIPPTPRAAMVVLVEPPALVAMVHGLNPQAEPRPPRLS